MQQIENTPCPDADVETPSDHAQPGVVRKLPLQQSLGIVVKICAAVQYAHEIGVFHRDIKPSNIVVRRDGEPILLDFGIAKPVDPEIGVTMTASAAFFGTIDYAAPEQVESSRDVDERADVYSIGAILYQMVTGRKHFHTTGSRYHDMQKLYNHDPVAPRYYDKTIDRDLETILLKALSPAVEKRYRSAKQLADDLQRYQSGEPIASRRPTVPYLLARFYRRNRMPVLLGLVLAAVILAAGSYVGIDYYRQWGRWARVYHEIFVDGAYRADDYTFLDRAGQAAPAWTCGQAGMRMARFGWCWLRNVKVAGDVRVVLRARFLEEVDGLEIAINSRDEASPLKLGFVPRGYSCQVGGYRGTVDFASINKRMEVPLSESATHREPGLATFRRSFFSAWAPAFRSM